jgi:hypothetical protein
MSDPQPPVGEPIEPTEEPRGVDDVVGSAHEGLADAAAAGEGAVSGKAPKNADAEPAAASDSEESAADGSSAAKPADDASAEKPSHDAPAEKPADTSSAADKPAAEAPAAAEKPAHDAAAASQEPDPWDSPEAASLNYTPEYSSPETVAATAGAVPVTASAVPVTASEPVAAAAETVAVAPVATAGPQQIFVQAPEAPRPRGNRGAAGAIGLLAAIAFGALFVGVWSANWFLHGNPGSGAYVQELLRLLSSWTLWTPVVVFFLGFWLLGAFINRGRWVHWVIWGILVGFLAWAGYVLGQILAVTNGQIWLFTSADLKKVNAGALFLSVMGIASFILARELTIWFGAWVAARGRKVTKHNLEAQREYERTLEEGPQLVVP